MGWDCCKKSKKPSSGDEDDAECDHPAGKCPKDCPTVEIEINDTPDTKDDLVLVKCERPAKRHKIKCRIRSTSSGKTDSVVLTNPDDRLRFPNSGDKTASLTVPDDGKWVSFEITGEKGSAAMNDAVIEARCMSASGPVIGTKTVTVVHFDQPKMDIATPGSYSLNASGRFTATGGNAVDYGASARIRPSGVDCTAAQIKDLKIGILQNLEVPYQKLKNWSSPTIAWNAGVASGTEAIVPNTMRLTISVPVRTNDSESTVSPLYDQPGKRGTLDANSLKPPMGCTGGGTATSKDTPSTPFPATFTLDAKDSGGTVVGRVTYTRDHVELKKQFMAWCVVFNTSTNDLCTLRERPWKLFVKSNGAGAQKATVSADRAPTFSPVTTPPFGNSRTNDPANHATGPVGAATTKFTKP